MNPNLIYEWRDRLAEYLEMEVDIVAYGSFFDRYCNLLDEARDALEAEGHLVATFPVGGGYAYYALLNQGNGWSVFVWLSGGPDNWDLLGNMFAIPTEYAEAIMQREKALDELFSGKED